MNKQQLMSYLERIDAALKSKALLYIYGSAALILLDEPERTSLDMDVAGPYSRVDYGDLRNAAMRAGLPINPSEDTSRDHIEWITALRLCLPKPAHNSDIQLWRGKLLTIKTVSIPALIASKLIRYDCLDQTDIQYLCAQQPISFKNVEASVRALPSPFNRDSLVLENLKNFKRDLKIWRGQAS